MCQDFASRFSLKAGVHAGADLGFLNGGGSVDIDGDYVVVGAQNEDIYVFSQAGAVCILRRKDTYFWEHSDRLTAPDAHTMDYFGDRVAISGDFALVGAKMEDGIADRSGSVYSFHRMTVNTWDDGPIAKIMAEAGGSMEFFGQSVAVDGEYAVVGADGSNRPGGTPMDSNCAHKAIWRALLVLP